MSDQQQPVEPITQHGHRSPAPAVPAPAERTSDAPKPKDTRSDEELRRDIRANRDELARTLDALEYKLDVPARGREFVGAQKQKALRIWDDNPLLVAGVGAAVVLAVAGGIVASIVLGRRERY